MVTVMATVPERTESMGRPRQNGDASAARWRRSVARRRASPPGERQGAVPARAEHGEISAILRHRRHGAGRAERRAAAGMFYAACRYRRTATSDGCGVGVAGAMARAAADAVAAADESARRSPATGRGAETRSPQVSSRARIGEPANGIP
jgi:hypothetical protein